VKLGTFRYRVHVGYPPYDDITSNIYKSTVVTEQPTMLAASSTGAVKPIIVLIDNYTPDLINLLSGLQNAGVAKIIQCGGTNRQTGYSTIEAELPDGIKVNIRNTEFVSP